MGIVSVATNSSARRQTSGSRSSARIRCPGRACGGSVSTRAGRKGSADSPTAADTTNATRQSIPASASRLPTASAAATPSWIAAPTTPTRRTPPWARAKTGARTKVSPRPGTGHDSPERDPGEPGADCADHVPARTQETKETQRSCHAGPLGERRGNHRCDHDRGEEDRARQQADRRQRHAELVAQGVDDRADVPGIPRRAQAYEERRHHRLAGGPAAHRARSCQASRRPGVRRHILRRDGAYDRRPWASQAGHARVLPGSSRCWRSPPSRPRTSSSPSSGTGTPWPPRS